MYLCLDCYSLIEELQHYKEYHGQPELQPETWNGCPHCGGWACVEAIKCDICDDYIKIEDGSTVCSNCYTKHDINDL